MPQAPELVQISDSRVVPSSEVTLGAELFVDFFELSVDLGGEVGPLVREDAAQQFSDVAVALEGDSFA